MGVVALMTVGGLLSAPGAWAAQAALTLMPLPSSLTRGEGSLTVTPAGGASSTFSYDYTQLHDARLEAAVKRALLRLGRTCGGDVWK